MAQSRSTQREFSIPLLASGLLFIATWVALTFFVIHPLWWFTEDFASYPFLLGIGIVLLLLGSGIFTRRIGRLPIGVAAVALASTALWQSVLFPLWIHGRFIPQPFIYLLLPAVAAIPIALTFFGGAKMIANRDETEQKLQDHRFVAVIAAVSQTLGGLLVAGTWWWLMSRWVGIYYPHFDVWYFDIWHTGPFLGATLLLVSAGTWALMSRRSVVCRASGLAGIAVALAELPFVVPPVFTPSWSRLIVVGFALALAASIALFVSGAPRGADSP